jgi:hypothetical protein
MAKVTTVEDFEKLTNHRGLVPMRFLKATITEFEGDIRGVTPDVAHRYFLEGLAEPLDGAPEATGADPNAAAAEPADEPVRIPADWEKQHYLKRIALAQQITGEKPANTEDADRIIREAIGSGSAAPAASSDTGPNAVTSASLPGANG